MINIKSSSFWLTLTGGIFLSSLALTPIHTKISGAAWVSYILFALIFIVKYKKISTRSPSLNGVLSLSFKWLLGITTIALLMRWAPQSLIGEFNKASTFNIRFLVILVITYFMCIGINRDNSTQYIFNYLPYALLFIGLSALAITLPFGTDTKFGTHPIPWAAAISTLTIVLHIEMLNRVNKTPSEKVFLLLGWLTSIAVLLAILVTGKRGSYFYLIWLAIYGCYFFYLCSKNQFSLKRVFPYLICLFVLGLASYFLFGEFYESIWERIILGYEEVILYFHDPISAANTSVGARLYMWHHALLNLEGHWLFGLGLEGTKTMIETFAEQSGAPMLIGLNQLHNEYLQALVSYGVIGLISFLLYPLGLVFIAFKLRKQHPQAFIGLLGMVFLFLTASLTNTNTYHNYFGTVFSLSVGLVFVVCRLQEIEQTKSS